MSTVIKTLHQENDIVIPRTKVNAVSDENGTGLNVLLDNKQETLVSGTNIKTINNLSILGSGDLPIGGNVDDVKVDGTSVVTDKIANINLTGKLDKLTTENAGENVTIAPGGGHNLPAGYTELTYIKSNGSQAIDTGVDENSNILYHAKYALSSSYGWGGQQTGAMEFNSPYAATWEYNYLTVQMSHISNLEVQQILNGSKVEFWVDGAKLAEVNQGTVTTPSRIWLFAINGGIRKTTLTIYFLKIYEGTTLIRDYVPCVNPENAIGLYDLVTQLFYGNDGSGVFEAGSVVTPVTKINALPGLTATVTELNYSDGVTSNIQTQLNNKSKVTVAETGTSTTKAKYITVDNTEYKIGGGDVTDVKVDGTSVVDASGVADIVGKENTSNKVTTISSSSTDTLYPSAKAVWDTEQDIKEIAEGKTKSFVCSSVTNPILNSQAATVVITEDLTDTRGNIIHITDFKIGDNVYIPELDVPDRWCTGIQYIAPAGDTSGSSSQSGTPSPTSPIAVTSTTLKDNLNNDVELRGISTYVDTYDAATTTITRNIGVLILTGTESWSKYTVGTVTNCYSMPFSGNIPTISRNNQTLCSHFYNSWVCWTNDPAGVGGFTFHTNGTALYMKTGDLVSSITDVTSWKAWLAALYESGNPVKIYYPLTTATTEVKPLYVENPAGLVTLYKLETAKVPVTDVKINNTSILSNTVANIPIAGTSTLGVVKVEPGDRGIKVDGNNGLLSVLKAHDGEIAGKTQTYRPIVPANLDLATMEGLGNNSLTWTDQYKQNARTTIGANAVSVSATGTSTTKVKYITVDSNEYKLPDQEIVQTTLDDYLEHEAEYSLTNNIYFVEGTDLIDVSEEER